MLILAIDTSTRTGSAAFLHDRTVLAEVSGYEETAYSSRLFRDVEELKTRVEFGLDEVDLFAVAAGPGSFTGLRVGLTAAKAWAEVYQKPIAGISGLEAIASEFQTGGTLSITTGPRYIVSFLDGRRGQIFGAVYQSEPGAARPLALAGDESVLLPIEFLETVKDTARSSSLHFVSPTPEAIPPKLLNEFFSDANVVPVSASLAPAIGRLGFERALRGEVADPVRVDANYVRRSDAEATWKDG